MVSCSNKYYVGTDLKFVIQLTATGFSQETDDYEIKIIGNNKCITLTNDNIVPGESEGEYYMTIDTSVFSSGLLRMIVTAMVPDEDFDNGIRREVAVQDLCYLEMP